MKPVTSELRKSIATQTMLSMAIRISLVITLVTGAAYIHMKNTITDQSVEQLKSYLSERGIREQGLFNLAKINHETMHARLLSEIQTPIPKEVGKEFDKLFIQKSDGTWRDREPKFNTNKYPSFYHGKHVPLTDLQKHRILVMRDFMERYGQAYEKQFIDTYFVTAQNSMILFWPGINWGADAPADLDMRKEEYLWVADPKNNPEKKTVWTGMYYDVTAKDWMVSVETPMYVKNEWVGNIGHDVLLKEILEGAIKKVLPGTKNIIFRKDGRLIAHGDFTDKILKENGNFNISKAQESNLGEIYNSVLKTGTKSSIVDFKKGNSFLATYFLEGPDWYFVIEYPKSIINSQALTAAKFILGLGLVSLVSELAVLYFVIRKRVALPLKELTGKTKKLSEGDFNVRVDLNRQDEIGTLADSFNIMTSAIAARDKELEKHTHELEKLVEVKTNSIKTILNNVSSGLFMCDENGIALDGNSRSCNELFGVSESSLKGKSLVELLNLSEREEANFDLLYRQIFSDVLPDEVSLDQIQKRFDLKEKSVELSGRTVRDENGTITAVLFTVTDITNLIRAENTASQNQTVLNILRQKSAFTSFLTESRDLVARGREYAISDNKPRVKAVLHTLKGNSAAFEITSAAELIHFLEERTSWTQQDFDNIEECFRDFLAAHRSVLDLDYDSENERSIEVGYSRLQLLEQVSRETKTLSELAAQVLNWTRTVKHRPAHELMGPIQEFAEQMAKRLGKQVRCEVHGGGLPLEPEMWRPVLSNVIHLIRNSLDHGIEAPHERAGKEPVGTLSLTFRSIAGAVEFEIVDDGRGLNINKIANAAQSKGKVTKFDIDKMSDSEKMELIFLDSVSTAETITEISGRGVGMSAFRNAVAGVNGKIEISSIAGKGTRIKVAIDLSEEGMETYLEPVAA